MTISFQQERTEMIKVLYVMGEGRSGSTLLDLLLGQFDEFSSLGEMQYFWQRGLVNNEKCSCSRSFGECDFWQSIMHIFKYSYLVEKTNDVNVLISPSKYIKNKGWQISDKRKKEIQEILLQLYTKIQVMNGSNVLIDSSKEYLYFNILNGIPEIEISVIHLVRDPRAVTFSWMSKKERNQDGYKYMIRLSSFQSATHWLYRNCMAHIAKRNVKNYKLIKYEYFVLNPKAMISMILTEFKYEVSNKDAFLEGGVVNPLNSHVVAGNPARLSKEPLIIKLDERWRQGLDFFDRLKVSVICMPLMFIYGYSLFK